MAGLLDIFGFISVLLRGLTLSLEMLTVGGVIFMFAIVRSAQGLRILPWFTASLALVQIASVVLNWAILAGTTDMAWNDLAGAGFCVAGGLIVAGAAGVCIFARTRNAGAIGPVACTLILAGSVMNSPSFARMEHRWGAMALTLAHHLASAAWIGGLLYLLVTLRAVTETSIGVKIVSRFSRLAMVSVGVVTGAGAGLALLYVRSPAALAGATYGIMLLSKFSLTGVLLFLGGLNLRIVRAWRRGEMAPLLPLRRLAEAELGVGFTVLLAAASLTSTPPAVDVRVRRTGGG